MRRYGWIALIVVVAVIAGYFAGRVGAPAPTNTDLRAIQAHGDAGPTSRNQSATARRRMTPAVAPPVSSKADSPLPAPGTPLKQIRDELQARAEAGDAEAATRLYRDTERCAEVRQINSWTPRFARMMLDASDSPKSPEDLKNREQQLASVQKRLIFARDNSALCADLSDEEINQLTPIALQAAQAGDVHAANCYVGGGGPFGVPAGLLDHPEWLDEYKINALSIANTAIARGDWIMVHQLSQAYDGLGISLLSQVTGEDKALSYRYLKLSRLGAVADSDKALSFLDRRLADLAGDITPDAKIAADAWAQDAYQNFFGGTPTNRNYNSYSICHADDAGT